jgi:small-conductance mechanosensitive channel
MGNYIHLVGPNQAIELLGVKLMGVNAANGKKLLFSFAFVLFVYVLAKLLRGLASTILRGRRNERIHFWTRQAIGLIVGLIMIVGLGSIWFDDPSRLATAAGLFTAGLAFALQKVVTAFAGYFVILRGKTFNVGDRIVMGGVRGDVIDLSFIQTKIMEMGQPPGEQGDTPSMWVHSRQYTGRLVTVTNDKIFDEPVYNYSHEFPYIWEEMQIPVSYKDDRAKAEQILLEVADKHTVKIAEIGEKDLKEMERRYFIRAANMKPKVYWRLTDNWIELSVRFIAKGHGVRELKDQMSRDIMAAFDQARIGIASGTYEIVGMPDLQICMNPKC